MACCFLPYGRTPPVRLSVTFDFNHTSMSSHKNGLIKCFCCYILSKSCPNRTNIFFITFFVGDRHVLICHGTVHVYFVVSSALIGHLGISPLFCRAFIFMYWDTPYACTTFCLERYIDFILYIYVIIRCNLFCDVLECCLTYVHGLKQFIFSRTCVFSSYCVMLCSLRNLSNVNFSCSVRFF